MLCWHSYTKIKTNLETVAEDDDFWRRVEFFQKMMGYLDGGGGEGTHEPEAEDFAGEEKERKESSSNKTDLWSIQERDDCICSWSPYISGHRHEFVQFCWKNNM